MVLHLNSIKGDFAPDGILEGLRYFLAHTHRTLSSAAVFDVNERRISFVLCRERRNVVVKLNS